MEKANIQNIIAVWKKLDGKADKEAFLEQVKQEIGAKAGKEAPTDAKAIQELVQELQAEVSQPAAELPIIEIYPADAEEAKFIEDLLGRMQVRYKVA